MAHTITVLTLWLAQALGLYCLAAGIGMAITPRRFRLIFDDLERIPALTYLLGAVAFGVGIAILIPHHVTADWLACLVTIIAVCAVIEGLVLIAWPDLFFAVARPLLVSPRIWAVVSILLGLILFVAGFTGRADALP